MKVLLVDDDSFVCNGLKTLIPWSELHFEIVGEARNGEEAFEIAVRTQPDLIITDIKMPVMDGMELCKKVTEQMADTYIILLSAYEDFNYACSAIQYGVKRYILKPISRTKINQLIDEIKSISIEIEKKNSFYTKLHDPKFEKNILEALKQQNIEYIESFFENELEKSQISNSELKNFCVKLINIIFDYLENMGVNSKSVLASKTKIMEEFFSLKTRVQIEDFIEQLYLDILQDTYKKKDLRSEGLSEYVKKFIEENYANYDLSLFFIADKMNMSKTYLSVMFKQSVGINISAYITSTRVEKAKTLLADPSYMISDISTMVGYQDSHYFARVFKKEMGVNPTEYKNLKLNVSK